MFAEQLRAAIMAAPVARLTELSSALWKAFAASAVTEAEAGELSGLIEARKAIEAAQKPTGGVERLASPFPARKLQRPPERNVAIERRRRLAASGPLPPALAARFTTGEIAVLRIVGDECRDKGRCVLPIDAIAARAGVGRTTAQNALREARRLGMVEVEERRQHGAKNLPNRVTVVDREWRQWMARGAKGIGFRKPNTTDREVLTGKPNRSAETSRKAAEGQDRARAAPQRNPNATARSGVKAMR